MVAEISPQKKKGKSFDISPTYGIIIIDEINEVEKESRQQKGRKTSWTLP